ncbi:MAG: carboxymuconolactone decarboxylase family protein [Phycisphaerales bacterium]|nr:carboxymuconolactone decarboxylase family protein [Phycisphaerales bacterium]|tara:strand:- start:2989 stop:3384 length:396 start_codon:yes stop_codon:yes gene_type:complete
MTTERQEELEGLRNMKRHFGPHAKEYVEAIKKVSPEYYKINVEWAFGNIYENKVLDDKTRELLALAALSCMGYPTNQIKVHVRGAINCGASRDEVLEVIRMMVAYAGFPATTNALLAAGESLDEHESENTQ